MKCSAGVGCVEEKQDQKIAAFGSSYRPARCQGVVGCFLRAKKGLATQDLS